MNAKSCLNESQPLFISSFNLFVVSKIAVFSLFLDGMDENNIFLVLCEK